MDLLIKEMREGIVGALNSYNIPIEVKRLQLLEIYNEVSRQADLVIKTQLKEREKNESNNQSDNV